MPIIAEPEGSVGNPNNPTAKAEGSVGNPANPTPVAEGSVGNPANPAAKAESTPGNPNTVAAQPAAAFPRSLTALVDMHFDTNLYSQNGKTVLFDDLFTYSRNSSATFINRRIVNNKAEFFLDTDFVGSVENLAIFAEQFDNAAWTKNNATVLANNGEDENGVKIADRVHPTTTGTLRGVDQDVTLTTADHDISFKVKSAGFDWVRILDGAGVNSAWFNVSAGVVGTVSGGAEAKIEFIGNGFYRCSIADGSAVSGTADIILADADNSTTATANGTDGILLIGAQATLGLKTLPYVKTVASSAMQTFTESLRIEYDPVTGENLGASFEDASTNLFRVNEQFDIATWAKSELTIVANDIEAPDNTISADKAIPSTNNTTHQVSQVPVLTSNTDVTISCFFRAAGYDFISFAVTTDDGLFLEAYFNIRAGIVGTLDSGVTADIEDLGNGSFLCEATFNTGTGATANTSRIRVHAADNVAAFVGDGVSGVYYWGAQIEELAFNSSNIRTEGSAVSRVADVLKIPIVGNHPPAGDNVTYHASVDMLKLPSGGSGTNRYILNVDETANFIAIFITATGDLQVGYGSLLSTVASDGSFNPSFDITVVYTASTNNLTVYLDAVQVFSGDAGTNPVLATDIFIGNHANGVLGLFGHIKKFSIYDETLTAQEVALL